MTMRWIHTIVGAGLMVSLGACVEQDAETPGEHEQRQAEVLWEELDDYQQWPVVQQDEQHKEHAIGADAEQIHVAPTGAIFVVASPEAEDLVAMQKHDDGLLWARYAADGEVLDVGMTAAQPGFRAAPSGYITCTSCHGGKDEVGD